MDYPSIKDSEIMMIAITEERTILTFERDYGELIFRKNYKPEKGVIYLRLDTNFPEDPGYLIEELLSNKEFDATRALTVLDKNGLRQRKY